MGLHDLPSTFPNGGLEFQCFVRFIPKAYVSDLDHLLFAQTAAVILGYLRHLDFSVMINWNGSMMSCIWMARCMASFLEQKLLESFVLPSRYDSWTLAYWKSLRRDDASPAFQALSGSVNEWVEVHWSNCYRRELLAYFQDLVGCIWERNIEAFPVLFLNDSCVVWDKRYQKTNCQLPWMPGYLDWESRPTAQVEIWFCIQLKSTVEAP